MSLLFLIPEICALNLMTFLRVSRLLILSGTRYISFYVVVATLIFEIKVLPDSSYYQQKTEHNSKE